MASYFRKHLCRSHIRPGCSSLADPITTLPLSQILAFFTLLVAPAPAIPPFIDPASRQRHDAEIVMYPSGMFASIGFCMLPLNVIIELPDSAMHFWSPGGIINIRYCRYRTRARNRPFPTRLSTLCSWINACIRKTRLPTFGG